MTEETKTHPPAPSIETVRVDSLKPWGKNPRKDHAVEKIARSMEAFGVLAPIIVQKGTSRVLAGHGRLQALKKLKVETVMVVIADLSDDQAAAYTVADNKLGELADWDLAGLADILKGLEASSFDLSLTGFDAGEMKRVLSGLARSLGDDLLVVPDKSPAISAPGDVWELGQHRLMCGDSTKPEDVRQLVGDGRAPLVHADPPYGMGKEADGVENDNLYRQKLDAFQMAWWKAWRPFLLDNASAYVWGQAEDLWRLWYSGGLKESERITFRNEIVWDKTAGMGQFSETHRQFATSTERCLFFMLGEQGFGNVNKDDYWEGFEPIRSYLAEELARLEWGAKDVARLTGVGMYGHWFTKSQWVMIPDKHYKTLQEAAQGRAFTRPYPELRVLYDGQMTTGGHLAAKQEFYGTRAYFDNVHDNMRDIWTFPRVTGEERFGHATPKPLDLTARAVVSSAPPGALVLEPFSGSGTTLIACESANRHCRAMELTPGYVDVAVRRWQNFTGKKAQNLTRPCVSIG
jgi:DNA modification methylase